MGNKLYTTELQNDAYTILHPDNTVVCQVRTSRASIIEDEVELETAEGAEGAEGAVAETDAPAKD